jgi:chorismate mutase/prephenate dehydratase
MAREKEGSANSSKATAKSLRDLRGQIDKIDQQILKLINDRARLAGEIGQLKTDNGDEVFSLAREEEVLQNVLLLNEKHKGVLPRQSVRAVFREIMSGSRAMQKIHKVAYLGGEYSFSHLAALERYGSSVEFVGVNSISVVFEEVDRGHVDFGVVPVENSTDGRISETLEMFQRMPHLTICAEIRLQIHHNLLANCDQQEIRFIYSKPQALAQCRGWLSKNVPHAVLKDVGSTAVAADLASKQPGSAAVASRQAAVKYGLRVLFAEIEDSPYNETRFAVIGNHKAGKTGTDKTALMFRLPHNPGSLAGALDVFKQNKINLTWIESFPARTPRPEYLFFVDFEGHREDPKVSKALKTLEGMCLELTVLGSFPAATLASS